MGRKSEKGKEKKQKRKQDAAKINSKVAVVQAVVDEANAQADPMEKLLPFKKYERNGLKLTIGSHRVIDLDEDTLQWAFKLTKENMQKLYEESEWGWNDKTKYEEMTEDKAWFLLARDEDNAPVAVVHFRYDLDFEEEVLYCYEIQLTEGVRRKGLGKFLMQILELLAHKANMKKVMCTVFNCNPISKTFFVDKLNYEEDETSPSETREEAFFDEEGYTYQILSKKIASKSKTTAPAAQTNGSLSNGHSHCNHAH